MSTERKSSFRHIIFGNLTARFMLGRDSRSRSGLLERVGDLPGDRLTGEDAFRLAEDKAALCDALARKPGETARAGEAFRVG